VASTSLEGRAQEVARPEAFEHALPAIVIAGVDELVATLQAA
jgi:hypothetical protein